MTIPTHSSSSTTRPQTRQATDVPHPLKGYKISLEQIAISNPMGLDLRCAALLARTALQCEAVIEVEYSGRVADGKHLMELVALDVPCNGIITVSAYGRMAQAELQTIKTLFSTAFTMVEATPVTALEGELQQDQQHRQGETP